MPRLAVFDSKRVHQKDKAIDQDVVKFDGGDQFRDALGNVVDLDQRAADYAREVRQARKARQARARRDRQAQAATDATPAPWAPPPRHVKPAPNPEPIIINTNVANPWWDAPSTTNPVVVPTVAPVAVSRPTVPRVASNGDDDVVDDWMQLAV
ncbi:MAG: hypothetical protein AAB276_04340 [Pseudomonadota bacterium]